MTALNVLQIQMGVPEASGVVEPLGEFTLPATVPMVDERQMIETALQCRPAVHAAQAQVRGADAAIRLAKGDRIPPRSWVLSTRWTKAGFNMSDSFSSPRCRP